MSVKQQMLRDCIRREVAGAIPEKKKRALAHYQQPLFAWIQGAHKIEGKSPIECVLSNQTSWPWYTLNASGSEFVRRVMKKKNLSFVQRQWLWDYIANRYQGNYKSRFYRVCDVHCGVRDDHNLITNSVYDFVNKCMAKEKIEHPPLRLILSAELAVLIELKTMEKIL